MGVMRFVKYLVPVWVALIFYSVASYFSGAIGVSAYEQLSAERDKQLKNIAVLQNINDELNGQKEALENDGDTIAVYARDMGMGLADERFIRIVGVNKHQKQNIEAGEIYRAADPSFTDDKTLRIISILIFIFIFMSVLIVDILRFIRSV
jgi:cell division protein FtsB